MKRLKIFIMSLAMTTMLLGNSIVASASEFNIQDYVTQYGQGQISSSHLHPSQTQITWVQVEINGTTYFIDDEGIEEAQTHVAKMTEQKETSDNITEQIKGLDGALNIKPDISRATDTVSGFIPMLNFILGIIIAFITTATTIFTGLDICWLVFPVFRGKCENMKQAGKGVDKSRTEKSGETKLIFISDEAEYALNAAETTQTGKNPVIIYGRKRAVAIVATTVVLFILCTGNISVVTNIALKAASGIINLIGEIGS